MPEGKKRNPRWNRRQAARNEALRLAISDLYVNQGKVQTEIAAELGISQPTVSRHMNAMLAEWRKEYAANLETLKGRENAELREMEHQASKRFKQEQGPDWLRVRVRIKERRAKMFGLDKPLEISGPGGAPLSSPAHVTVVLPDNGRGDRAVSS